MLSNLLGSLAEVESRQGFLLECNSLSRLCEPHGGTIHDELDALDIDDCLLAPEIQKIDIRLTKLRENIQKDEEEMVDTHTLWHSIWGTVHQDMSIRD